MKNIEVLCWKDQVSEQCEKCVRRTTEPFWVFIGFLFVVYVHKTTLTLILPDENPA